MTEAHSPCRSQRVPSMLQAVFLRSNRGEDVNKAPPQRMAQKTFFQNWLFKRNSKVIDTKKKVYDKKQDKVLQKASKAAARSLPVTQTSVKDVVAAIEAGPTTPVAPEAESPRPVTPPPRPATPPPEYTLQEYFDALIKERGYSVELYETLKTGYSNEASALQVASYGPRMVQIVRDSNVIALRETLAVGLSPNPCNQFGESLLHMICRRGDVELLKVMIEAGSSLQVSDDYGRTPLHDAFWAAKPAYGIVELILQRDAGLFFMKDKRGALPLSYATKKHWPAWMEWLDAHIDEYFPESTSASADLKFQPSDMVAVAPNTFCIPDPKSALGLELIRMVACGDMNPAEARLMAEAGQEEDETTVADTIGDDSSSYDDDDSDFDSDDDSDDDSEYGMEEDDMMEMLQMAQVARSTARA